MLEIAESTDPYIYYVYSCAYILVHLKEALSSCSLAYLNCQHCYSCTVELLLCKIRIIEHKHCDTMTVDLISKVAAQWLMGGWVGGSIHSVHTLDKGMIHITGGTEQAGSIFHNTQKGAQCKT